MATSNNAENDNKSSDILTELMMLGAVLINVSPESADIAARACDEIDRLRNKVAELEESGSDDE